MSSKITHRWVLAGILLVALGLRVWALDFGLPYANARPDETSVAGPAVSFLSGDFEPPHFLYPTGFMYALSGAYVVYYEVTRPFASYKTLHEFAESRRQNLAPFLLVSRGISVAMALAGIVWLYRLGTRVAGRPAALAAAAMLAVAFLHVRDSHFGVTDITMTSLVVLAVWRIVRWHEAGGARRAMWAGLAGGLAMGTKYNGLGVAVPFAFAALDRLVRALRARGSAARVIAESGIFAVVMAAVFAASTFYLFIQSDRFRADLTLQSGIFNAGHGLVMPIGWLYHAVVTLPAGVGWPVYLSGLAGIVVFFARAPRRAMVVMSFPIAYYIVAGSGHTVFARYVLPVVPFLCLGAGIALDAFVEAMTRRNDDITPTRRVIAIGWLALVIVAPTAMKSIAFDRLLARTDNRVIVSAALQTTVPSGATIYHSGNPIAKIQYPPALGLREVAFDAESGAFAGAAPDFVLLQKSALALYSDVPERLAALVARDYQLVQSWPAADDRPRLYDPQDAFFLPLAGFDGIERPGPSFELYARKP